MCASGVERGELDVLVVDDEPDVRLMVRMWLSHGEGFGAVSEAINGLEAIALVKERCPDVVILDMRMPDLDGLQTARQLKKICPRTKVVLYSAHLTDFVFRDAAQSGVDLCLSKTTMPHDIVDMVRHLCAV